MVKRTPTAASPLSQKPFPKRFPKWRRYIERTQIYASAVSPLQASEITCLSCICDDNRVFRHPERAMAAIGDLSAQQLADALRLIAAIRYATSRPENDGELGKAGEFSRSQLQP